MNKFKGFLLYTLGIILGGKVGGNLISKGGKVGGAIISSIIISIVILSKREKKKKVKK